MQTRLTKNKSLPAGIWALGFVSLFMDISSEMIHGLLPVFLVSVIGASATTIGMIEGIGEGLALIAKVFSGVLSDWLGRRKIIIVSGYLLATLSKPLFAIAQGAGLVLAARSLDRLAKGIRGAPRDALIADLTPTDQRGAAYGLRQALDSFGAFLGPLIAVVLMSITSNDFRAVFWLAVIPGIFAVIVLLLFVREPVTTPIQAIKTPLNVKEIIHLRTAFWWVLAVGIVFTLARFSEAFLLLRAVHLGMAANQVPLILMVMSLVYALGAYPAGKLSDRFGRMVMLSLGLLALIIADLILALADNVMLVMIGAGIWGLHMALTQGLFAALIADTCTANLRGTAFGVFGLATGLGVLAASIFAGWLWDHYSASATFYAGMVFSIVALLGFLYLNRRGMIIEN